MLTVKSVVLSTPMSLDLSLTDDDGLDVQLLSRHRPALRRCGLSTTYTHLFLF